jgi:hypothetical protein
VVVVVEIGYECLDFLFTLTACGRGAGVGISSLERVGLGWMDSAYQAVAGAAWAS